MPKFIIVGALPTSLLNFRKELILSVLNYGYSTVAMASGIKGREKKI